MTLFYCSNGQQTSLLTVRATFLQIKLEKSKLEWEMYLDIKIQVSCDMKESTLGSSSTIFHPLSEVRGRKFCLNSQHAKSVDCSSNISSEKTFEKQLRGRNASGSQNSGKFWYETEHLGQQFNHFPSFNWGKRSKILLEQSTSQICWLFLQLFFR